MLQRVGWLCLPTYGTAYRSHLQGSGSPKIILIFMYFEEYLEFLHNFKVTKFAFFSPEPLAVICRTPEFRRTLVGRKLCGVIESN